MPDLEQHVHSTRRSSRGLKLISAIRHRLSRQNKESGSENDFSDNSPKQERDNAESDDSQDSEISPIGSQSDKQVCQLILFTISADF